MNRAHLAERGADDQLDARIASLEMAFRMQGAAQEAFDLGRETEVTRRRYGDGEFANACLLARRLVERGVRVVQIYYGNNQPWDDHKDITLHADHAQKSDRPIAALLTDLKTRGLLGRNASSCGAASSAARRSPKAPPAATTTPWASRCG